MGYNLRCLFCEDGFTKDCDHPGAIGRAHSKILAFWQRVASLYTTMNKLLNDEIWGRLLCGKSMNDLQIVSLPFFDQRIQNLKV